MDIFAHALWTAAGAKALSSHRKFVEKNRGPLKAWWAALWGIFPDLFAFGFPFIAMFYLMLTGQADGISWASHHFGFPANLAWIGDLPPKLYNISHSFVTFGVVFLIVWAIRRRPYYELLGWALHICIDIPSHAGSFYPTPLFWPLSGWKFLHGVSWANPTYMIINYTALSLTWIYIVVRWIRKRKALSHNKVVSSE